MTELRVAFQNSSIVPYTSPFINLYAVPHMIMALVGILFLGMILFSIESTENSMKLVISLCVNDLVYLLTIFSFDVYNISKQGFAFGYYGCVVNCILIVGTACNSLLHIVSISMERYISIFYRIQVSDRQYLWLCMSIWSNSFLLVLYPVYTKTIDIAIDLSPGLLVCVGRWTSHDPTPLAFTMISTIVIGLSTTLNCFAYTRMFYVYSKIMKSKDQSLSNDSQVFHPNEKKLLIKAAVLTITFIVCWTPYFCVLLYSVLTQTPVSLLVDAIASLFCVLNAFLNPFLLYFYDGRIKRQFINYWGFDLFRTRDIPKKSVTRSIQLAPTILNE